MNVKSSGKASRYHKEIKGKSDFRKVPGRAKGRKILGQGGNNR